jgi:hypothetical protein
VIAYQPRLTNSSLVPDKPPADRGYTTPIGRRAANAESVPGGVRSGQWKGAVRATGRSALPGGLRECPPDRVRGAGRTGAGNADGRIGLSGGARSARGSRAGVCQADPAVRCDAPGRGSPRAVSASSVDAGRGCSSLGVAPKPHEPVSSPLDGVPGTNPDQRFGWGLAVAGSGSQRRAHESRWGAPGARADGTAFSGHLAPGNGARQLACAAAGQGVARRLRRATRVAGRSPRSCRRHPWHGPRRPAGLRSGWHKGRCQPRPLGWMARVVTHPQRSSPADAVARGEASQGSISSEAQSPNATAIHGTRDP